jgi:hypothetical protein
MASILLLQERHPLNIWLRLQLLDWDAHQKQDSPNKKCIFSKIPFLPNVTPCLAFGYNGGYLQTWFEIYQPVVVR